jgi:hypothetical protein
MSEARRPYRRAPGRESSIAYDLGAPDTVKRVIHILDSSARANRTEATARGPAARPDPLTPRP